MKVLVTLRPDVKARVIWGYVRDEAGGSWSVRLTIDTTDRHTTGDLDFLIPEVIQNFKGSEFDLWYGPVSVARCRAADGPH